MNRFWLSFILVLCVGMYLRFYNYSGLVDFHLDPPLFMHDVLDMVESGKPRLIGSIVTSKMVDGRSIFSGPIHYYILAILGVIFNWDIIWLSAFYTLLWPAGFVILILYFRKRMGDFAALGLFALLMFLPQIITTSRQIWNPHLLPIFLYPSLLLLVGLSRPVLRYFVSGLLWGLAFSANYSAILILPVYLFVIIRRSSRSFLPYLLGALTANLPLLVFELRHDFYNFRTAYFLLTHQTDSGTYTSSYYYLYPGIIAGSIALAIFFSRIRHNKIHKQCAAALIIFAILCLRSPTRLLTFPAGWDILGQKQVVDIIQSDSPQRFNVATTIHADTRSLELRWWVRRRGLDIDPVDAYANSSVLYLVAPSSRPPETETVWEVSAMRPFETVLKKDLGNGLVFYKLVRKG